MRLTLTAWDAIEAADLDELAFLLGVLCVGPRNLEIHHAVRALLENPPYGGCDAAVRILAGRVGAWTISGQATVLSPRKLTWGRVLSRRFSAW